MEPVLLVPDLVNEPWFVAIGWECFRTAAVVDGEGHRLRGPKFDPRNLQGVVHQFSLETTTRRLDQDLDRIPVDQVLPVDERGGQIPVAEFEMGLSTHPDPNPERIAVAILVRDLKRGLHLRGQDRHGVAVGTDTGVGIRVVELGLLEAAGEEENQNDQSQTRHERVHQKPPDNEPALIHLGRDLSFNSNLSY